MKKIITLAILLNSIVGFSCTTFILKNGNQIVFGRNLDWYSDNGIIVANQHNQKKKSIVFPPDNSIEWVSKYGSITFNQFGKELPFGGINEKGLVIEIMVAPAQYPETDDRGAVNELQWIQYQLDNATTIDEVIENDKKVRLRKISQDLHFLIADKNGDIAVIEFKKGKMIVYKGDNLPIPVLENDTYDKSLEKHKGNVDCRFSKAANMINAYQKENKKPIVDYSFDILDKVALDGSWSIVYDIENMSIHFKTASNKNIKTINFSDFDFECKNQTLVYNLQKENKGQISSYFEALTYDLNTAKMKDAMKKGQIQLPENIKDMFYSYYLITECKL